MNKQTKTIKFWFVCEKNFNWSQMTNASNTDSKVDQSFFKSCLMIKKQYLNMYFIFMPFFSTPFIIIHLSKLGLHKNKLNTDETARRNDKWPLKLQPNEYIKMNIS